MNQSKVTIVTMAQEAASIMEKLPRRNQQIVLDLLRVMGSKSGFDKTMKKNTDEKMRTAALELAGLWKNHDDELSVEETVRNMRKGRHIDH